ncbi:MAG: thrombospondin type 3 repeat-containing protein [Candidatus Poseidoniaceae archaeon]|nr:thrombospondin type 3 repeat-containing protein [Candidatus Poseidoniaceae archaeon]
MRCSGQEDMTEEEIFNLFDDFIGGVNSIAWGIGSSADLKLPYLASPISNYTVLGIVQQGSGTSATITSAIGSQVAEANPEPLVMKNLTLDFMPDNPSAGDSLLITATDEETGAPVGDLSVVILVDGVTIDNSNTNSNGQTSFILPEGELLIRVSGGMYNAAEFMITVTSEGTVIEDSPDTDGDGISDEFDTDDDNDGIPDTDDQCPDTPIGATVDSDGCPSSVLDSDGDGVMDDDDLCPNTPQGTTVESDGCEEAQLVEDADLDGVEDGTDLCPDTPTGEVTNSVGCSDSQLDAAANEEEPNDESNNSASDSSNGFFGMDMLTIGGIGGVILALAIMSLLYVRRGGSIGDNDWKYEEDVLFDSQNSPYDSSASVQEVAAAPMQSGPPSAPPPGHKGQMSDGYEVTEYPEGSGSWWWKDPAIDSWSEWS